MYCLNLQCDLDLLKDRIWCAHQNESNQNPNQLAKKGLLLLNKKRNQSGAGAQIGRGHSAGVKERQARSDVPDATRLH